jgi:hypothetical protein
MRKVVGPVIMGLALTTLALSPDFALADASAQGCLSSGGQPKSCTTNSVPVSGSTLVLFGAGFLGLALWHHRRRGNSAV